MTSRTFEPPASLSGVTPMVLAAGFATRLRPLTTSLAKAAVPFLNRPLIDYLFEALARCGFDEVFVNLHHAPESIVERFGRRAHGLRLRYRYEPTILGTAGGPRAVVDEIGDTLLILNGDVVAWPSLGALVRHHRSRGAAATLAMHRGESARGYPTVTASADGALLALPGDEPEGDDLVRGVFTGVHLVERELLATVDRGVFCGIVDPVYRSALDCGLRIDAVAVPGSWYEVGDPGRYIDAQLDCLERGRAALAVRGALRYTEGAFVSHHTQLENVRLRAPFLIGAGTRVKHGSRIARTIAGDRCRLGSGCDLDGVVVWDDASIGPNCRLRRVVVMDGVSVPAGTRARDTVFTHDGPEPYGGTAR